jgi:hypothetical protein
MYDYNLETQRVRVGMSEYEVMNDLKFHGEYTGQIPYLRRNTKISVYKWLRKEYPSEYLLINNKGWFEPYKRDVEDGVELVIPDAVRSAMENKDATPKKEDNKSVEIFQDAINKLADKIGDMGTKIEAMNTNTKLEDALIQGIVSKGKELATEELEKELKDRLDGFIKETYGALPQKLTIVHKDIEYDKTGIFHKMFDKVLKLVDMNLPVMLTGGAGAGKNFMLEQVSNALGLDFYYTSTITQEYKLTGFIDGGGKYHETEFYKAFTQGGVFMLDEIDASIPECLVILNGAIANGYFDFPTGREIANENFRVVCAGNTVGLGADLVYTGRNVLDGATLDRFVLVEIDYDSRIEENLCQDEALRNFLYDVRHSVKVNHINHIIGMRCFKYAYQLLMNDFDKEFIVKSVILKGLQADDINVLKSSLNSGSEWYQYVK